MIRLNLFMIWFLHFLSLLSVICRCYRQNSSSRIIVVLIHTVSTPFYFNSLSIGNREHNILIMRYRLLLFLSMLFISTYINAQSEITGFLGIKLEDKPYVAIDKLKKRYPNVEWKHPCIHLKNVTFIDTKFNDLVITYKNEKLVEATFTLFDDASVVDNPFKDRTTILNEVVANT